MDIRKDAKDGVDLLHVDAARIDASMAIRFKDEMRTITAQGQPRVVLDLSTVEFIDSSGLGAIVAAMKAMPAGTKLELAGLTDTVDKVFRMTRMDSIFTIHPSRAEAISCGS
ncbi:STAS domain-containing protein [Cognatishimia sp. F0-27]|uniref:STAS domain-containing protein n=1 Tax=Cognatishimia sp. F0-27 TaxID=2816855 RepID=UPI001D0C5809|nr:STAS domain-containing protein [Cognatishimia sp. F0-27]MCC1492110.1 STAS domain-containing protein [Cognatishimia sp. F0-27]